MDLFGRSPELGDSNFDFVLKYSEEIQRRVRNYQDTLLGTQQTFESGRSLRNVIFEYGAKPVAFSDMLSAAPLGWQDIGRRWHYMGIMASLFKLLTCRFVGRMAPPL